MTRPTLAITMGDPAGIGPEIRWNPTLPWMLFVMALVEVAGDLQGQCPVVECLG